MSNRKDAREGKQSGEREREKGGREGKGTKDRKGGEAPAQTNRCNDPTENGVHFHRYRTTRDKCDKPSDQ